MIHYGDITKIDGSKVEPVDIVTFGAPCQDISVAGKRKGMKNTIIGDNETTRSGLFYDAIRVIKEMRNESIRKLQLQGTAFDIRCVQPRYAVYENVPGAFSSNHGEDFRCVLEEICRIADKAANVPISRGGSGQQAVVSWEIGGALLGVYMMRSFGEFPREERESHLSQIL